MGFISCYFRHSLISYLQGSISENFGWFSSFSRRPMPEGLSGDLGQVDERMPAYAENDVA